MTRGENRDLTRDIIVRVSPSRNTLIMEEQKPGGIVNYKEIDPVDFYYAINKSYLSQDLLSSGFLPEHCLQISMNTAERQIIFWNPELRADVTYLEKEYLNFPIPRLVFGVRMLADGRVVDCSIGVVADETPSPDTQMFYYPFSNVYADGHVCTGNNVLPRYKKLTSLKYFPRYLLGVPDNDDYYDKQHNRLELPHGELLEHLKDKEPSYYSSDILVPNGKTLADFICGR